MNPLYEAWWLLQKREINHGPFAQTMRFDDQGEMSKRHGHHVELFESGEVSAKAPKPANFFNTPTVR